MKRLIVPLLWRLGLLIPLLALTWLNGLDCIGRQLLFQIRGPRPMSDRVRLLAIDEASIDPALSDFGPWPWPRALQAELAAQVLEQGAQRVVFNIVYPGESSYGPEDDAAFLQRLDPWLDRIILSASYLEQTQDGLEEVQLRRPVLKGPSVGLSNFVLNPFGVVEAVPGFVEIRALLNDFQPPYPPALATLAAGINAFPSNYGIDFLGPAGQVPLVTPHDLDNLEPDFWRDRIVVFGASAPSLGDQLETPFGQLSGSEVLVAAISGLLEGRGFRAPTPQQQIGVLLIWLVFCLWRIGAGTTALFTARQSACLMLVAAGSTVLAWTWGLLLPGSALMLMPVLAGSVRTAAQFQVENSQRRFLKSVLSRRVSPNLMEDMVRSGQAVWTQLGGRRTRCVVLFTDLVGFTARSNAMEPEELFRLLNRYFEAIAAPVLNEQGLLDKFIGDSLMAEFGVPQHRGDQVEAMAAVRAALAMRDNLAALNAELVQEGQAPLAQGIGIHFGEVMAGNLGSSHRLEYTVIGASVNLASRLESLTRCFPDHAILMSREVHDLLAGEVEAISLGFHPLKGWPEPVEVFSLLNLLG